MKSLFFRAPKSGLHFASGSIYYVTKTTCEPRVLLKLCRVISAEGWFCLHGTAGDSRGFGVGHWFYHCTCGTKLTATRVPPLSWHMKLRYMDIITERWTSGERYGEFRRHVVETTDQARRQRLRPDCGSLRCTCGQWDDVDGKKVQVVPTTTCANGWSTPRVSP